MLGIDETMSFFEGFASSNVGTLILNRGRDNNIVRIDLGNDYSGRVVMANGDRYDILNVIKDSYGKITRFDISKVNTTVTKRVTCLYDAEGYLTKIGTVEITGVSSLNVQLNLQNKTATSGYSDFDVTYDEGYDGLGVVTVKGIPNGNLMHF